MALGGGGGKHAKRKSSSIRGATRPTSHGFSLRATAPSAHAPRCLPFAAVLAAQAEPRSQRWSRVHRASISRCGSQGPHRTIPATNTALWPASGLLPARSAAAARTVLRPAATAARKVAGEPAVRPQQLPRSSGLSCFRPTQVTASQNGCARHAAAQFTKLLASSRAERQVGPLHPARPGWSSLDVWTA